MKKLFYYILLLAAVVTTSCKDSYFDINDDPNNPVKVGNEFLLTSGIAGVAYVHGGYYQTLGGFWSQHYAQSTGASQWATLEEFSIDEGDYDVQFTSLYSGALMDLQVVRDRAKATGDWSYYLAATAMQSYSFSVLSDLYDQIPFSEALSGTKNLTPHYESGKDVTDSLIQRLDFALSQDLSASTVSKIGTADLVFQGDMSKWVKFANSLKLKLYLRFVNVDANKYSAQIKALLAENNFLDVPATMTAFKDEENGRNPYYETFVDRLAGNIVASKTIVDTLATVQDTRLNALFVAPVDKNGNSLPQVGLGQGRYKADAAKYATIKNLSTPLVTGLSPVYFFTVPEVLFLMAEAEARYGTAAKAEQDYISGINASYAMYGLTPQAELYAATGPYAYKGIESIITQKWIAAVNTTAIESFFDKNRTGYPGGFVTSAVSSIGDNLPQRILFPDSERKSNPNTPQRKAVDVKVWFAIK
ncbi:MAG: SusD/RagB family nutrient-binding outer membrane lipoprotein [Candidatus Dadabacteria bacterium]